MDTNIAFAEQIAVRLSHIDGVAAVVLGGSRARGAASENSDTDLGIYYYADNPPDVNRLRVLAHELEGEHPTGTVTGYGEWGPWINGGAWLTIGGERVDWLYREIGSVADHINQCIAGDPTIHYQPGHPHGFQTHFYMAEVYYCQPLYDPNDVILELKALTHPYPPKLKAVLTRYLWEAGFALDTSKKSAARGESFYVAGGLFRCAACLVQVLFAMNEQYFMNEKGSVEAVESFRYKPDGFSAIVNDVLGNPGTTPEQLSESIGRFEWLVEAVNRMR
jgi:hypothetical protein